MKILQQRTRICFCCSCTWLSSIVVLSELLRKYDIQKIIKLQGPVNKAVHGSKKPKGQVGNEFHGSFCVGSENEEFRLMFNDLKKLETNAIVICNLYQANFNAQGINLWRTKPSHNQVSSTRETCSLLQSITLNLLN